MRAPDFAGHYPGFPIVPGVFLIEFAQQAVRDSVGAPVELTEIESCRFVGPAFPAELLAAEIEINRSGADLSCTALVTSAGEKAAEIRFRARVS